MSFTFGPTPGIPWLTLCLIAVIAWLSHSRAWWKSRCRVIEERNDP